MNRVKLVLAALAGSTAAGVAIVVGLLQPDVPMHISCPTDQDQGICTAVARPDPSQCPSVTRNGGDFLGPFEAGDEHALGRALQALKEHGLIQTWHAWGYVNTPSGPDFSRCEVEVKLTREQAREWREALTEAEGDAEDAPALLDTVPSSGAPRTVLAGEEPATEREAFDLQERTP